MCRNIRCQRKASRMIKVKSCVSLMRCRSCIVVPPDPQPPVPIPEITIVPTVSRYFYIPRSTIDLQNGATIPATLFYDDDENQVAEFILFSPNGYVNLYINGVIQGGGFYKVNSNTLTISPAEGVIYAGTPIIIESLGFSAQQSS